MNNPRPYYTSLSVLKATQLIYKTLHQNKINQVVHYVHMVMDEMWAKRASDMNGTQRQHVISLLTDVALLANRGERLQAKIVLWDLYVFLKGVAPERDAKFD